MDLSLQRRAAQSCAEAWLQVRLATPLWRGHVLQLACTTVERCVLCCAASAPRGRLPTSRRCAKLADAARNAPKSSPPQRRREGPHVPWREDDISRALSALARHVGTRGRGGSRSCFFWQLCIKALGIFSSARGGPATSHESSGGPPSAPGFSAKNHFAVEVDNFAGCGVVKCSKYLHLEAPLSVPQAASLYPSYRPFPFFGGLPHRRRSCLSGPR